MSKSTNGYELHDKLMSLDTFTRETIIREFPNVLYVSPKLDTTSTEHFVPVNVVAILEKFAVVIMTITAIGYIVNEIIQAGL